MKQLKPGDVRWYRDRWGMPTVMVVDYQDLSCGLVVGRNDRGGFVRVLAGALSKTLVECEGK